MPISERKNTRIGISKTIPSPAMMVRNKSVYSLTVIIGLNWPLQADQEIQRRRINHLVPEIATRQK